VSSPSSPASAFSGRWSEAAEPRWSFSLKLIGALLLLYLSFGKGFSYAGYPPVFIGELGLTLLVLALVKPASAMPDNLAGYLTFLLLGLGVWQVAAERLRGQSDPLETIRGFAVVYYALYAVLTFAALSAQEFGRSKRLVLKELDAWVVKSAPKVGLAVLFLALLLTIDTSWIPVWPKSHIPIFFTKATDLGVGLAALLPVIFAEPASLLPTFWLAHHYRLARILWMLTALLVIARSRGALLGIVAAAAVTYADRLAQIRNKLFGAAFCYGLLAVSGLKLSVGGRELSSSAITQSVASLIGEGTASQGNYADTREWRARWWKAIWHSMLERREVISGRGWGDNLAVRYGIVSNEAARDAQVLRLPHNLFFSVLGRAGLLSAVLLITIFSLTVIMSSPGRLRRSACLTTSAARAGIVAAVVVGMTDIYIESPQGGIVVWIWCGALWWSMNTKSSAEHGALEFDGAR
jgi:O-Antigen ligase